MSQSIRFMTGCTAGLQCTEAVGVVQAGNQPTVAYSVPHVNGNHKATLIVPIYQPYRCQGKAKLLKVLPHGVIHGVIAQAQQQVSVFPPRYGMTEVGMALSNPYHPAGARRPGTVGAPLPGVEADVAEDGGCWVRAKESVVGYGQDDGQNFQPAVVSPNTVS